MTSEIETFRRNGDLWIRIIHDNGSSVEFSAETARKLCAYDRQKGNLDAYLNSFQS